MLADAASLKRAGEDFASRDRGTLTLATTHTQARYALVQKTVLGDAGSSYEL